MNPSSMTTLVFLKTNAVDVQGHDPLFTFLKLYLKDELSPGEPKFSKTVYWRSE